MYKKKTTINITKIKFLPYSDFKNNVASSFWIKDFF